MLACKGARDGEMAQVCMRDGWRAHSNARHKYDSQFIYSLQGGHVTFTSGPDGANPKP